MTTDLSITEIYASVQGESSYAGLPCVFVRLSGCPLRCRWCDTVYSFKGGETKSQAEIVAQVLDYGLPVVELTGGEPLAQAGTPALAEAFAAHGLTVLIETGGSEDISTLPSSTHIIMDLKCPGSGMDDRNRWENIAALKPSDEIKFVVADRADFDWALARIKEYELADRCRLLMSPAWGLVKPADLVDWMLEAKVRARLNLQQHKYIWSPRAKGV